MTNYFVSYGPQVIYYVLREKGLYLECLGVVKKGKGHIYEINTPYIHKIRKYEVTLNYVNYFRYHNITINNTDLILEHPRIINDGRNVTMRLNSMTKWNEHDYKYDKIPNQLYEEIKLDLEPHSYFEELIKSRRHRATFE